MENRELWEEFGAVETDVSPPVVMEEQSLADGDGAMLGRVLVYASIVMVGAAMLIWKRIS
jgi:hypothetical protein